ncbi:MAG: tRNA pseudouridine(13) synthase TruD [Candidatus Micrarchaeia archaeon]
MFNFQPDEFIVEEITSQGAVLEVGLRQTLGKPEDAALEKNYFSRFIMEKREWNTAQALGALAAYLHAKPSRFDSAGAKDRNAVTVQLCSAFCIPPERLLSTRVKDVRVLGAWRAGEKVRLGDLQGNRFTITLNTGNCGREPDAAAIKARAEATGFVFKNYFGYQRFGSNRENTALVGECVLRGNFKEACTNYLCFQGGERQEASEARARLASEGDYAAALAYYPRWLKYERTLLEYLATQPTDYAGALRRLPRSILLLFVHALQAKIFNESLEAFEGAPNLEAEGNLVGYESQPTELEAAALEARGLTKESFRLASMPELSSRGNKRKLFTRLKGFEVRSTEPVVLRFSLDSGCYATTALDFLLG